ncbi:MAG: NAD(P)/FAD-dependent oxidoreductase [Flavobacteriales bacterium]|nr:NAD(P)/FAD-dependent oxidoreductase [Flavobacteriales bacterium]MCW8912338.1 NAD(P)/FAD-dependent oxidoreductase [Flavobacteriales bacterium]MCW8938069.1 NAD(P)/FAD-dependent oxidoreductase [Flavobacteriales bacterium]MCW8939762.1 NAD(P)/FAD-dependent oxidoreductase [Flavobacteriales bacterium]MCW8969413.1 NAD(P)/FAD-dependent oxidoreductase [Flavobacteriales bacterium]
MKISIPTSDKPRIVIIGGGFAGVEIAKSLKNSGYQIVMLDKHNYHAFQPLLYQVATSALEADSIAFPLRKIFEGYKDFYFRMAEVNDVIPEENLVISSINEIAYDYLIIATGSKTNFMNNEGLTISSMPMKSITEALNLRSLIFQNFEKALVITNERKRQGLMNFVIAGAGPTGVELAGALGELKSHILPKDYPELDFSMMQIYLVQSSDRVLPALSPSSSEKAQRYLEKLGVNVVLNTRVLDYFGDYVQTNTEDDLVAKTLIWTAGVVGAPIKGIDAKSIVRGNRIAVDKFNKVKGYENIFAIGDVAAMITEENPKGHPMVAPVAIQQGRWVGKNLKRIMQKKEMLPFVYHDKGAMATIGKNKAVVEMGKMKFGGAFAWYVWMFVHLMSLVGFRNRVVVFFNWARNYFNSDRGMRLIIFPFKLSKVKRQRKKAFYDKQDVDG